MRREIILALKTTFNETRNYDSIEASIDNIYPYDDITFCPECNETLDPGEENWGFGDDYSNVPMVWCENCDCKCVPLGNTARKLTLEEIKKEFPELSEEFETLVNPPIKTKKVWKKVKILSEDKDQWQWKQYDDVIADPEPVFGFMIMNCAKIKRISTRKMREYKLIKGGTLTDDDVEDFFTNGESEEDMDRLGIEERYYDDKDDIFGISVPVDSYNVAEPKYDYPYFVDLCIDGAEIYILCEDENGNEFMVDYTGD